MNRLRDPGWMLIALFAALIASVPLVQTVKELGSDEGLAALELFNEFPDGGKLREFEDKLEEGAWAAKTTRPWFQYAQFKLLKEGGEKVLVGKDGWYFFKPGLKYMLARHDPAHVAKGENDPVAAIVDFRNQLAARGVHLLLVPVPNKESIYPDRLTGNARPDPGLVAPRTREIFAGLRAANVEVIDLYKEFSEARQRSQTPLYLSQDTHWSPEGVAIAARIVSRRLIDLGWVQQGRSDYQEKSAPVQRLGDILRMLQTPYIERNVAPENVAAVQVLRGSDGQPYKDEATAEVLVLGDSFMRIYQTDTPTSAGFISHLAKELKQPMMSLVNDGGGSTLVREELAASPLFLKNKKVLIWEFVERDIGLGLKGWRRIALPQAPTDPK